MEFRLLYSGQLLGASRTDTRSKFKHEVRRALHPQLKKLWTENQNLRRLAGGHGAKELSVGERLIWGNVTPSSGSQWIDETGLFQMGVEAIGRNWSRRGYNFVPLVTESLYLKCGIEILFLRPNRPGKVIQAGDLDNRLKTLFDAFRIPKDSEFVGDSLPPSGEDPFFCLLEDDSLITEIRVITDSLLLLPNERELGMNDVFLIITVTLNPTRPVPGKWVFE